MWIVCDGITGEIYDREVNGDSMGNQPISSNYVHMK